MATDKKLAVGKHLRHFGPLRDAPKIEITYLAGLLEGEGYFGCAAHHKKRAGGTYRQLRMAMVSTDEDVIQHARSIMNLGRINGPYKKNGGKHRDVWQWCVTSPQEFMTLAGAIWPYLGERRQKQIREALLEWRAAP